MVAEKSFAVKLNKQCTCFGCVGNVKDVLEKTKGVHSSTIDANEGKVTVSGTADPHALLAALRKHFKRAELLPEQFESKSMQIVPAKPVHGVHDHPHTAPQLQQLSENNDQVSTLMKASAAAADDDDKDDHQCACDGCVEKVKKVLKKTEGVHSRTIDANEGKVTVSGTTDPHALLAASRKHFKTAELLPEQFESKSMQIVPAKPVHGVHDHPHTAPQLQQLSENNDQVSTLMKASAAAAADDDDKDDHHHDDDDDDDDEDDSLGMSNTKEKQTSHEHHLELKNYNKPFICSGCKELGFGPRFKCECCDYELHRVCKECWTSNSEISPEFFEGCTFKFFDQLANKICDACGKDICGFAYHSEVKGKSLDLHPCCSELKSKLCIDGYDFELHYEVLKECKWCNKKDLQGSKRGTNISGWSYISARKSYHFHVYCVTEMVREAWRQGYIDNIDSLALKKLDTKLVVNSNRNDRRRESDHQFSRHTTKMFLKAIVGVLLGDPTMLLASFLVDMFT